MLGVDFNAGRTLMRAFAYSNSTSTVIAVMSAILPTCLMQYDC